MEESQKEKEMDAAWAIHAAHIKLTLPRNMRYSPVSVETRERLAEAQNWRCCYCGVRMWRYGDADAVATTEHIIPRCFGGPDEEWNLVVACSSCNFTRGSDIWVVHITALAILEKFWPIESKLLKGAISQLYLPGKSRNAKI